MKKTLFWTVLLFAFSWPNFASDKAETLSLVSIIANPEKYNDQKVIVIGYAAFDDEGHSVFLSKNDRDLRIYTNSLTLSLGKRKVPAKNRSKSYPLLIEGTFSTKVKGHLGIGIGGIREIVRIERYPSKMMEQEIKAQDSKP